MLKEMYLVEGEVIYKTRVALLVTKEEAENEAYIEELLEEKSHDGYWEMPYIEYDNEVPVLIREDTIKKYYHETLSDIACREILLQSIGVNIG